MVIYIYIYQGVQQLGILWEFDLPRETRGIFLPVYENFLNGLLLGLLPDNDNKIICKIILVSYDINDCI